MNEQTIKYMSLTDLLNSENVCEIQKEPSEIREQLKAMYFARLSELKADNELKKQVKAMFKAFDKADKELSEAYTRQYAVEHSEIPLQLDGKGQPMLTMQNFLTIFRNDKHFDNLRFNELSYRYEKYINGKYEEWKNVDDSKAMEYIETKYKLYHEKKFENSIRIAFYENQYHPIKQILDAISWDKKPRMENLFIKWLKCEDTDYAREVTRLVFAGGINRIYNPGCKFDDVCVLVGTNQGEGKSSFVKWLALEDKFFAEVKNIDSKDDKAALQGKWICELAELMAVTKTKEVEEVKSFITTQTDRYRMAYDKRPEDYPRQCVFIGTTNKEQFLTDKTGNRRWYPLKVNSVGYDLFDHKDEIKRDIIQCWAEAKSLYDENKLPPYADFNLLGEIREKQAQAVEDDYRIGMIESYLKNKDKTCILELWKNALDNPFSKPTRKESNDISLILQSLKGWVRGKNERFEEYGTQLCWYKTKEQQKADLFSDLPEIDDDLPI